MVTLSAGGDVARVASLAARLSNRFALHVPASPIRLAPDRPLVSFTFDDAPDCACTLGARMLADYGVRGTYYIAGGLIERKAPYWRVADADTIAALHEAGHEIGSHTFAHACLPDHRTLEIVADLRRNHERLQAIVPGLVTESFAYPYGLSSVRVKRALRSLYRSGRGIRPGLNLGAGDRLLLRANPLIEGGNDPASIGRLMDEAVARRGWLIFYGHDVARHPSPYGCAPHLLQAALQAASVRGIACVTVAEGLRRATEAAGPALDGCRAAPRWAASGRRFEAVL